MTMSSRNRSFVIAAVLVLLVGLATGFVAYYTGWPNGSTRRSGPEELRFVSRDAAVLGYVNVREVMGSEAGRTIWGGVPPDGVRELKEQTGVDLEHDIDHLVVGMEPHPGNSSGSLLLARGRIDESKIEALVRQHGGEIDTYKGKRLLLVRPPEGSRGAPDTLAVSFIESGLVAAGTPDMVRGAVDRASGGDPVTSNREMMAQIADVQQADAWLVGRFDLLRDRAPLPENIASQIPAITWISASGRLDGVGAIQAVVRADARDDAAAASLRDVVRGLVALAKLQGSRDSQLRTVAESVQLGGTGRTVVLSFSLSEDALTSLSQSRK